jgi:hypothetical protein
MHIQKSPDPFILAMRIQRVANPTRGYLIQVHDIRLLLLMEKFERNFFDLFPLFAFLVTVCVAVYSGHTGVRHLVDLGMTFATVNFAMGGAHIAGFINMQHPESAVLFKSYQSRILVTGQAAPLIE